MLNKKIPILDYFSPFEAFEILDLSSFPSSFLDDLGFLDYLSTDFLDLVSSPLSFLDLSLGGLSATLSFDLLFDFFSLMAKFFMIFNLKSKL